MMQMHFAHEEKGLHVLDYFNHIHGITREVHTYYMSQGGKDAPLWSNDHRWKLQ